jgi:hypothetical protein
LAPLPAFLSQTQRDLLAYLESYPPGGAPADAEGLLGQAFPLVRPNDLRAVAGLWSICQRPYAMAIYHLLRAIQPMHLGHAAAIVQQRFGADAPEVDREAALLRYVCLFLWPVAKDEGLTIKDMTRSFDDHNPRLHRLRDQ